MAWRRVGCGGRVRVGEIGTGAIGKSYPSAATTRLQVSPIKLLEISTQYSQAWYYLGSEDRPDADSGAI